MKKLKNNCRPNSPANQSGLRPVQPNEPAQRNRRRRGDRTAHPIRSNCQASRPIFAKTLAALLAAQLATLAGCGSIGGLPSGAPWAQQTVPSAASAPLADLPANITPTPSLSSAKAR
ncbi:MAG: hypothetical protein R3C56_42640 [Pirellulaceae bacterium]